MSYQLKTTMVHITVWDWNETSKTALSSRLGAVQAVAVQIAIQCQMDIISFNPFLEDGECTATVIYINNGRSLSDIRGIMAPEMNNKPQRYWMIQDFEEWQGLLNCTVTTRGIDQTWD